jgi:hypothetical protein
MTMFGREELEPELAELTLGALVKYREDAERVAGHGVEGLVAAARVVAGA